MQLLGHGALLCWGMWQSISIDLKEEVQWWHQRFGMQKAAHCHELGWSHSVSINRTVVPLATAAMNGYIFYVVLLVSPVMYEIQISQVTQECFNNPFSDVLQVCENTCLIILL